MLLKNKNIRHNELPPSQARTAQHNRDGKNEQQEN